MLQRWQPLQLLRGLPFHLCQVCQHYLGLVASQAWAQRVWHLRQASQQQACRQQVWHIHQALGQRASRAWRLRRLLRHSLPA